MGSAINQKEEEMIVSAPQSTLVHTDFRAHWRIRGMNRESFPTLLLIVNVLLYISAGKLIGNRHFIMALMISFWWDYF